MFKMSVAFLSKLPVVIWGNIVFKTLEALLGHIKVLIYSTINEHSAVAVWGRGEECTFDLHNLPWLTNGSEPKLSL